MGSPAFHHIQPESGAFGSRSPHWVAMSQDAGVAPEDSGTSDWYRRAAVELAGTSDLQVAWAEGIAADETVVALIDRLPREHRQPSLVFSVARWLGAPAAAWPEFREFLV